MTPHEQLLAFLGGNPAPTDPVRIMKGMFLFTQKAKEGEIPEETSLFTFEAMNYGPCATQIYATLRHLAERGLVAVLPVEDETWVRYQITSSGLEELGQVLNRPTTSRRAVAYLQTLRSWCDQQSFRGLLSAVYRAYPDFARNSVLPQLRPNG